MAEAETSRTTNEGAARGRESETTTRTTAAGGAGTPPAAGVSASASAPASGGGAQASRKDGPRYFVDGRAVGRDEYMKAAGEAGWNPTLLAERNFFPAISTTK